jgi:hypothetical protein
MFRKASFIQNQLVRIKRVITCSKYVAEKRSEIIRKNCLRGSIPILSDIIVTDINEKGHIPYFEFMISHVEYYLLSTVLLALVDFMFEYKKCSSEICEISD